MTHVIHQSTSQFTRAALLGLMLVAAAFALFSFTPRQTRAAQTATAQPTATPPLYTVRVTHVKPGMEREYRQFMQNEMLPAYVKGGLKETATWATAQLGVGYEYVTVSPHSGLKRFDEPSALNKALGQEGARAMGLKWSQMVTDTRQFIVRARPELSIPPKTNEAPKLAVVYRVKIAPNRANEYEDIFKNFALPQFRKTAQKALLMSSVGFGGDSNEYICMFLVDSFTDMEKWTESFAQAGSSGAGAKLVGIVVSQESAVYRYVPELSIRPEAQKAAQ